MTIELLQLIYLLKFVSQILWYEINIKHQNLCKPFTPTAGFLMVASFFIVIQNTCVPNCCFLSISNGQ